MSVFLSLPGLARAGWALFHFRMLCSEEVLAVIGQGDVFDIELFSLAAGVVVGLVGDLGAVEGVEIPIALIVAQIVHV